MSLSSYLADHAMLPDSLIRLGIRRFDRMRLEAESKDHSDEKMARFIEMMRQSPIAIHTDKANDQHYEMPPRFFQMVLGKHLKYSGCYWDETTRNLDDAEAAMLALTARRAGLTDGMQVLELGCGWGSLSLWMAEHYPRSRIVAVSNSRPQGEFIRRKADIRVLKNLTVITADMNDFATDQTFDRVVSVEMFEHMRNWPRLLGRIATWLKQDGRLFVHIFSHQRLAYTFDMETDGWMARHFFSGGMMPSDNLLSSLKDDLVVEAHWRVDGTHYSKTAEAWLANLDADREAVLALFEEAYGKRTAKRWFQRWRIFFMACAELWGYNAGYEWIVSHYLMKKKVAGSRQLSEFDTF